jgi:16S rRNA (uracil1498-N3)-methyltransferase
MAEPVTFFFGRRWLDRFEFSAEDSHHLVRVLRHAAGDVVWGIDGSGTAFEVRLTDDAPRKAKGEIIHSLSDHNEPSRDLILIQGLIQQSKMDWLVEKATELGAREVRPAATGGKVGPGRLKRWERICRSAAKQCLRGRIPTVSAPLPLEEILANLPAGGTRILADFQGSSKFPDPGSDGPLVLAVGPERGFSAQARQALLDDGFQPLCLGSRRLRAETAAVTLLSVAGRELSREAQRPPDAPPPNDQIP